MVYFTPDATDGIDVSDCVMFIPAVIRDASGIKSQKCLNTTDLAITADLTPIAACEQAMGAGYTVPQGCNLQLGGGPLVISVEDDTG